MPEYIERASLITAINDYSYRRLDNDVTKTLGFEFVKEMASISRIIEKTPTADVAEVKHTNLNDIVDFGNGICVGYCSNCGTEHRALNPSVLKLSYRYCRWCGAKMDLKEGAEK